MYLDLQLVVDSWKMDSFVAGMQKWRSGRIQPLHAGLIISVEPHLVSDQTVAGGQSS